MQRSAALAYFLFICTFTGINQVNRFKGGEELTYNVYYHLWGVWVGAGTVTFSVFDEKYRGYDCFKFEGVGVTLKRYDWFYKVYDVYSSYADKKALKPYRFSRDVSEGGFYFKEENIYSYNSNRIYSILKVKERPLRLDTIDLLPESFDVLSLMYYCRNMDFSKYEVGEKIPIKMVIDREIHDLFVRYVGIDVYDHSDYGKVECHVIAPLLVAGSIFREGERMKVWFTKDNNQIPIYVESEIRVGSIRAELKKAKGLKYDFAN